MARRLLIVHETLDPQDVFADLPPQDFVCERAAWASFDPERLRTCAADLIALVAAPNARCAFDTFEWLKHHPIASPTIAVLPENVDQQLLQMATAVVDDFVVRPVRPHEWRERIVRLIGPRAGEAVAITDRLSNELGLTNLVGQAPGFLKTIARIPVVSRSGRPVLITGETGTGKELCARAVHHLGPRRRCPFIPVDCGAIPDHLFENELFGHVRGAFTDAHGDQKGLIAMANGGTLFLDEIDALPLTVQSKLLRFLQDRTFKPLGGDFFISADVNVLAATNRDLKALVREQRFRGDLYYRVNVLTLHLDPLRQRRSDIPLLAQHFADAICGEQVLRRKTLSAAAIAKLEVHDWPGNVRELYNVMERAVVFSQGGVIRPSDVALGADQQAPDAESEEGSFREARARAVALFERAYVETLLRRNSGNVTWAARAARKERRAFGRLVKKYGLQPQER
jgi:DNA-binding NtrC family response regulator